MTSPSRERDDEVKLAYAARMMIVSAVLFGVAGVVWLVSGQGGATGIVFVVVAAALLAASRLIRRT